MTCILWVVLGLIIFAAAVILIREFLNVKRTQPMRNRIKDSIEKIDDLNGNLKAMELYAEVCRISQSCSIPLHTCGALIWNRGSKETFQGDADDLRRIAVASQKRAEDHKKQADTTRFIRRPT